MCQFHLSYFQKLKLNRSLIPGTSAQFNRLFETPPSPHDANGDTPREHDVLLVILGTLSNHDDNGGENVSEK